MFLVIAAVLAQATAAPAASTAPLSDDKPLRTIVYKVSYSLLRNQTSELEISPGAPLDTSVAGREDHGTVTVDIMRADSNGLGVRITELWGDHPRAAAVDGFIAPDGTFAFPPNSIAIVTGELLPLLGPMFTAGRALDTIGTKWTVDLSGKQKSISTTYRVAKINADTVTLEKSETIKVAAPRANSVDSSGTISYKPGLHVAISGDITQTAAELSINQYSRYTLALHFNRISDTLEPGSK